jgi:hypothetical protein
MPQTIARLYGNQAAATAVAQDLQQHGFSADNVHVIGQPSQTTAEGGTSSSAEAVLSSIRQTGVPPEHAQIYADRVRQGQVLVAVYPPFGYAHSATSILDSHNPVAVDLPAAAAPPVSGTTWDNAAPLSSALGLRVLSSDPAPLSRYFNWRTTKPQPATSQTLEQIRRQSDDAAPLSAKIGMKVLSDNPTPLSTQFGMTVQSDNPAPLSTKLGWRVLSEPKPPLSEEARQRVLMDNPAPLSNWLGWRLLSDNPTPLSSMFGWSVLSKR